MSEPTKAEARLDVAQMRLDKANWYLARQVPGTGPFRSGLDQLRAAVDELNAAKAAVRGDKPA